jgi:hypothetical protein
MSVMLSPDKQAQEAMRKAAEAAAREAQAREEAERTADDGEA